MNAEKEYLRVMRDILDHGVRVSNRTGVDTLSLFGTSIRHDYEDGFPLLTTKKIHTRSIIHELLWFLKGTDSAQYLVDNHVHIWDEWMKEVPIDDSDILSGLTRKVLPFTYGTRWRDFDGVDQIQYIIDEINTNPDSRRLVLSAWDPRHVKDAALTWCHIMCQFNVVQNKYLGKRSASKGEISICVYQRSADWFLGVGFNIASYSFLLYMIAKMTGYTPKQMIYNFGDSHIYVNHIEQCKTQLSRIPYKLPSLKLRLQDNINHYVFDDFEILNYRHHPIIKAEVAV